jgi:hypothetical protein
MSTHFFIFDAVKTNWVYKFVKYLKKVYFKNDKRVAAYLVCVAIATGFWFLNALSKTYTVKIVAPVEYYNLPNNKTLANNLPDKFEMTIRSHGFTILRRKLIFLLGPLSFNVNEMTNSRMLENKKNSFAFPTRQFLTELSYQLSNDIEILSMTPDTLFFRFGQMTQKRVPVKPVVNVNLKKQFQISGEITTEPNTIVVNGPQSTMDTLQWVYTKAKVFNTVDESIQVKAEISPVKELFFDPQSVELVIPVEEYTEAQQSVPVMLTDTPANVKVKLFPARVKVSFLVGLSRFSEIHPEDFKLAVSYTDIEAGQQRLRIKTVSAPAFLYDVKITPEEIEYLIEN